MLASGWSSAGLVRHLAIDVECFWIRDIVGGATIDLYEEGTSAWEVPEGVAPTEILQLYRDQIELANAVIAATPLDAVPARWPEDQWPSWQLDDLREVLVHVIAETACHAGHLDAVRELIDGRTWM